MSLCVSSAWVQHLVWCLLIVQGTLLCCWGASQCPKLHFLWGQGCQPCSLCKPSAHYSHFRNECREANPVPLADGRVLWCDSPVGPFPECPSLHPFVLQNSSSKSCTLNSRTFAPGCVCTVGCPGQPSQVVVCTERLKWNSTDVPSQCLSPSDSLGPVEDETSTPKHHKSVSEDDIVLTILLGSLVSLIILVTAVIIMVTCLYQRRCPPPSPGASGAPLLHSSFSSDERSQNGMRHGGNLTNGAVVIPMGSQTEVGEDHNIAVHVPATETAGTQQRETGRHQDEDRHSIRALAALMKSRKDLLELSKRFDQEYAFDKVTWHDVALDLLGWDSNDMRHTEYKYRSFTGSSPGDGPLYQVLEAARQGGKGLLDLVHCLRRQRKRQGGDQRCQETEEVLTAFWQRWMAQQVPGQPC